MLNEHFRSVTPFLLFDIAPTTDVNGVHFNLRNVCESVCHYSSLRDQESLAMYNQINTELKWVHFWIQVQQRLVMLMADG